MNIEIFDAVLTRIATILGALSGWIFFLLERRDKYRIEKSRHEFERKLEEFKKDLEIKYEVRIKTHQEAYSLLMELADIIDGNADEFLKLGKEIKKWWIKNSFYLDKDSRNNLSQLYNNVLKLGSHKGPPDDWYKKIHGEVYQLWNNSMDSIHAGIKVDRLDILEKPAEKKES